MFQGRMVRVALAALGLALCSMTALAQEKPDAAGPAKVTLGNNLATFNLPKGYVFLGAERTKKLVEQRGGNSKDVIGLIEPVAEDAKFAILLEYEETGYIKDDDAGKIDAKKILESYQEGTEAQNDERKERGEPALHVTGWEQEPAYNPQGHVVVWSLQGENDKKEKFVNYNTRVLSRHGVLSVNLICDNPELPTAKPKSQELVKQIAFAQGERYEDYQSGDKVSTLGLVGLIAGGALLAKKTGLLALLFVWFKPLVLALKAGGAKLIAVVVAAGAAVVNKIRGKRE